MTFLSNFRIPANPSLHDIEQNLNLLQFLDIKKPTKYFPHLACSAEDTQYAEKFILKNNIKKGKIIGFHSGSGTWILKDGEIINMQLLQVILETDDLMLLLFDREKNWTFLLTIRI